VIRRDDADAMCSWYEIFRRVDATGCESKPTHVKECWYDGAVEMKSVRGV